MNGTFSIPEVKAIINDLAHMAKANRQLGRILAGGAVVFVCDFLCSDYQSIGTLKHTCKMIFGLKTHSFFF